MQSAAPENISTNAIIIMRFTTSSHRHQSFARAQANVANHKSASVDSNQKFVIHANLSHKLPNPSELRASPPSSERELQFQLLRCA
eukprot:2813081-Amphidinium_carterae.1